MPRRMLKRPSSSSVKRETSESGNERRFTRYASRVSRTLLADFFSILLSGVSDRRYGA